MRCMYSEFGHHPHPLILPNFVYSVASIAELADGEKSLTHSICDSLTELIDEPATEACASELSICRRSSGWLVFANKFILHTQNSKKNLDLVQATFHSVGEQNIVSCDMNLLVIAV